MNFESEKLKEKIEELLYIYVGIKSDTGTASERNVEEFYQKWFDAISYFKENPENRGFFKIPNDHLGRNVPWALFKGCGSETVVLLHHSDTVDTEDYTTLRDISLRPKELMQAMKEGKIFLPDDAKADLESDEWIFGRGVMDMKGGAAIHLAIMEAYTKLANFKGNVLLLSVPDEENLSAGAIGAVYLLNDLKDKFGLEYKLCLLSEPDSLNRSIQNGSVGKIMPLIYVRGKLAHVGRVYDGLNPVKVLAKVIDYLDLNPEFIETNGTTTTPAPTFLYAKDQKKVYDVSLPAAASGFISLFCFNRTPKELMELMRKNCENAMRDTIKSVESSFAEFSQKSNTEKLTLDFKVNVKLYSELYAEAIKDNGDEFISTIKKVENEVGQKVKSAQMTLLEASHVIIERTLEFVKDLSPVVVITLVPPYYPYVSNEKLLEKGKSVEEVSDEFIKYAKEKDGFDYVKLFVTGMCDFSYMMQTDDKASNDYIENNMMMWGNGYYIPFEKIRRISMPILNIGPLGKGIHQYTERVYKKDLFYTIPNYIDFVIKKVLKHE